MRQDLLAALDASRGPLRGQLLLPYLASRCYVASRGHVVLPFDASRGHVVLADDASMMLADDASMMGLEAI